MKLESIRCSSLPPAVGPYSQATAFGSLIYTSGQIPMDPVSGNMVQDVGEATRLVLSNLLAVVEAGGGKKKTIVKVDVFLKKLSDFDEFNKAYAEFFGECRPARVLVQAGDLAEGAILEVAVVAFKE